MEINKRNRTELKSYFVKNAIPTASNFADLIEGALNQKDDGIVKLPGDPLSIEAAGDATSLKKAINFYRNFNDANPDWTINLNPRSNPNEANTARLGFNISDGDGNSRLFIDRDTGNVGISTTTIHNPQGWNKVMDILGTSNARLNVRSSGGVVTSVFSHDNWDGARGVIGTDSNHPLTFTTNYTHRMMIDTAGNVGIGTTALAYKLTVRAASTHLQLRRESTETTGGKHVFLELLQNDPAPVKVPEVYPSIRFHHNNRFWDRIEARPDGFHFKTGDLNSDNYVDVRAGRISSSMWKATRLFDRKPGPLPVEERFSSSGGTLVVFTSGTAYKSPGGFMSLQITIDGTADRFIDVFTNEANSHKAFPTTVEIFTGIAAGTHTFKIAVWSNTAVADTNDRFYATILELPF